VRPDGGFPCGSTGCVEAIIGASAVLRSWRGRDELAGREPVGIDALFAAHRAGDADAVRATSEAIEHLGLAVSNLVHLYNPEKIIVSGWFGDLIARDHTEELRAAVRRFSLKQPGEQAVVERDRPRRSLHRDRVEPHHRLMQRRTPGSPQSGPCGGAAVEESREAPRPG
jgi:predicted NBD/HSP70 family sugar kinase